MRNQHPDTDGQTAGTAGPAAAARTPEPSAAAPTTPESAGAAGGTESADAAAPTTAGSAADDTADATASSRGRVDRTWDRIGQNWALGVNTVAASRIGRWFKRIEQPSKVDWALLIAISALAFVTFLYGDIKATFEHSFNFLDALFQGRPQDFYQVAIDNNSFGHPAVYDIPLYFIFGLWNLPTYLMYQFADYDYLHSIPALLWLKTMLVVFTLASAWLVMKIARELGVGKARAKWAAFFFLSSMTVFIPVLVVGQYDIISITFMLAGVLAYMRGRTRAFLVWFLLANTFKLFAVFIFIPLILLREKRLPRAAGQLVVGLLGVVLCRLLYRGNLAYEISTGGFTDDMLARLGSAGFQWYGTMNAPLFVVFMVGLAIFAYVKRPTSVRETQAFAIYLSLAAFVVFIAIVPLNPYWVILVAPFTTLIIFANPRRLTLNSLLEVGIGASIWVIYLLVGYQMFQKSVFSSLLTGQVLKPADPQRFVTPRDLLIEVGLGDKIVYLIGFMLACVIAVLIINYPRTEFVSGMPNAQPIKRSIIWIRLAAPTAFCAFLVVLYVLPQPPTAYSSTTNDPWISPSDLLAPGGYVEEQIEFDETLAVDTIQIGLDASKVTWINTSAIQLSVLDEDGSTIAEDKVAANAIGVGMTRFDMDGLVLEADQAYTLRLTADAHPRDGEPLYIQLNHVVDEFETIHNGVVLDGDLVLVVNGSPEGPAE